MRTHRFDGKVAVTARGARTFRVSARRCVISCRAESPNKIQGNCRMSSGALDPSVFANYVPLNALRPESQRDLAKKAQVGQAKAGDYLFKIGEQAKAALYVMSGEVQLEDASGKALGKVIGGT